MLEFPDSELRTYSISNSCIFKKNEDEYGGLSNMSTSFVLEINGLKINSTETIYQALKFPENIPLQRQILEERSPFKVKMLSRKGKAREDWNLIKIKVMRWCLQIKLAQNYHSFGNLLRSTGAKNIVEFSDRDKFWGASKINDFELQGQNALGRLLMQLRKDFLENPSECLIVSPPKIDNLFLLGQEMPIINTKDKYLKF